uniref:SAP domain-containing ribonucleoprotein n=1 Tax=Anser brachyrhynchus TaxID=132585 RepID=A0A8B9CIW3_9AVES
MAAEPVELHKLKLAELKQECLARGLEAKGNKQDLINRLQAYLEEHGTPAPPPPHPADGHGGSPSCCSGLAAVRELPVVRELPGFGLCLCGRRPRLGTSLWLCLSPPCFGSQVFVAGFSEKPGITPVIPVINRSVPFFFFS